MNHGPNDTQVIIVGGGPVGLALSLMLSGHGVRHLLLERHTDTTYHPKARNLNTRTTEIMRSWGVDEAMDAIALGPQWCESIAYCRDLATPELGRMQTGGFVGVGGDLSPAVPHLSSQDVYEPVWRDRAEELAPGSVRFGHGVTSVDDSAPDRIVVSVEGPDGPYEISADYLVGCDGWNSMVRRHLGVVLEGRTELAQFVNVYFRADLGPLVGDRPAVLYFTTEPRGVFQPLDGGDRWLCQITHLEDTDPLETYDDERCLEWVRLAAADPSLDVEILSIGTWTMNATVADRYRVGRCFMAGDSIHQLPPTGGFGANTGIQDAHNLAWKLAAVLRGAAGEELLDTYEAERRAVAGYNATQSLENSRMVGRITVAALRGDDATLEVGRSTRYGNFTGMELGFAYTEGAVIADGSPPPQPDDPVVDYVATARPGHRLPHSWLDDVATLSTLDLVTSGLVLVCADLAAWNPVAKAADVGPELTLAEVPASVAESF
ncbi:MAG: FAD-dependent monooxygenase, partial [Actinomycetota bacterium]|nr:FAD-dependent monooxygenase [Actinomycetota bacterium]